MYKLCVFRNFTNHTEHAEHHCVYTANYKWCITHVHSHLIHVHVEHSRNWMLNFMIYSRFLMSTYLFTTLTLPNAPMATEGGSNMGLA